ncbi:MAG: triose-phosphate isomerase [Desulfohalobiaceae bacterium]
MRTLIAANWKMHMTRSQASSTAQDLVGQLEGNPPADREVLILPPFTSLEAVSGAISGKSGFSLGGQDFYPAEEGAYTGEVSPNMLLDAGCAYALAGHSERRHFFRESDELVGEKLAYGLEKGLHMILCVGETLEERKSDAVREVLSRQLRSALDGERVQNALATGLSVAYEPVWAIGTGEVARPEDIREAHAMVREELTALLFGKGEETGILYGGSVKPDNISQILGIDNVNGVLVGGASLKADSFSAIARG